MQRELALCGAVRRVTHEWGGGVQGRDLGRATGSGMWGSGMGRVCGGGMCGGVLAGGY
jgi:hypothetical protein